MQKRTSFSAQLSRSLVALLGLTVGCGSPPRPVSSTQPTAEPVAAAPAAAPPPHAPTVWTTPEDSKECREYAANSPDGVKTWPDRAECEEWVKTRACSPGFSCFDGCNWRTCDGDGSGYISTQLECEAYFPFEFTRGTSEPVKHDLTAGYRTSLAMRLKKPERQLRLVGYADAAEAATPALRQQLGLRRAERLRKLLVSEGFDADRIQVGASEGPGGPSVRVYLEPSQAVREDFPPGSAQHDKFCARSSSTSE